MSVKRVLTKQTSEHVITQGKGSLHFSITFHFNDMIDDGFLIDRSLDKVTVEGDLPEYIKSAAADAYARRAFLEAGNIIARYRERMESM